MTGGGWAVCRRGVWKREACERLGWGAFEEYAIGMRCTIALILVLVSVSPVTAGPDDEAGEDVKPFAFIEGYRISRYLDLAVEIQKLEPAKRAARLTELAADRERGSDAYVLCRMLFEAKESEFRRPMIGAPEFVDSGSIESWPLEPITLQGGIPILVVCGYSLAGYAERPREYVRYCLADCQWRDAKYAAVDRATVKRRVDEFIAKHPKAGKRAAWVRRQME